VFVGVGVAVPRVALRWRFSEVLVVVGGGFWVRSGRGSR